MKNNKFVLIVGTVLVVALITVVVSRNFTTGPADQTKQTVKIGLIFPLTGNVAFLGESAKNAAQMAIRDAGDTKYNYQLLYEDDAFNPVKSVTAANKLINVNRASYIVNFGSATGNAVAPIVENNRIPHFSLASDPTAAVGVYNYINWTPPFNEGRLLAQEMIRRGYKTVSIIDTNHSGTLAVTDAVKQALQDSSMKIVSYDLTNVGDTDFRTTITKIKKLNPDIVVMEQFSPEIELTAKQMRELGFNVPVTSVETFEWSNDPSLFDGNWFVSDVRMSQNFIDEYKAAYGSAPKPGASYIYDLVTFIIKTQEASPAIIKPSDVPDLITKMGSYQSSLFGTVRIDKDGFFLTNASVKKIENGQAVYVD